MRCDFSLNMLRPKTPHHHRDMSELVQLVSEWMIDYLHLPFFLSFQERTESLPHPVINRLSLCAEPAFHHGLGPPARLAWADASLLPIRQQKEVSYARHLRFQHHGDAL